MSWYRGMINKKVNIVYTPPKKNSTYFMEERQYPQSILHHEFKVREYRYLKAEFRGGEIHHLAAVYAPFTQGNIRCNSYIRL